MTTAEATYPFQALSDSALEDEITTWAGRVAAGEARLLELIGEFDRREAWFGPGLLSCAHWLSWRLGMGLVAAHERVRVARALPALPLLAAAYRAGKLSWTQIRAIARVAGPGDQLVWLELARHATGAQLEKLVRGVRRGRKIVEDETDPDRAAWKLRTRISYDADGTLVLTVRLPAEHGAVVLAALESARAELDAAGPPASAENGPPALSPADPASHDDAIPAAAPADGLGDTGSPSGPTSPPSGSTGNGPPSAAPLQSAVVAVRPARATLSQALLHLAAGALTAAARSHPEASRRRRAQLTVQIDPLSGWSRLPDGEFLPPGALPAPSRPDQLRPLLRCDLTRHDLGRSQRTPSLSLRQLIGTLDGERCRFPGCTRHRHLHAHHVLYWSAGGTTDLANLLLLCPRHHTLVHSEGFRLDLAAGRELAVRTCDGTPVLHHPAQPWQPARRLDPAARLTESTLPPSSNGDRLDLGYAVSVLLQQTA